VDRRHRLLQWSRRRGIYLLVAIVAFLVTEAGRFIYRPWVFRNGIDDWGLAGSIGNLTGIITQIFFILAVINEDFRKGCYIFLMVVPGYILYEFTQRWLPGSTFDINDIIASIMGGLIALVIYLLLPRE
jgi:hypothetical protein